MKRTGLLVVVLLTSTGLSSVAAQDQQTGTARAPDRRSLPCRDLTHRF